MSIKKNAFLISLLLVTSQLFSQITLSEKAEILVLTLGPTQTELYSAFGHSAIRVYDPKNNINRIYNYGVFDFNQPNFYLNFARGFLNYKLDTVDYPRFRYAYIYYNRFIHEQVLNFTLQEKQQFFDFLEWNMLPENQYYYYDYFFDNCATRVRDALEKAFPNQIEFNGDYIQSNLTIRELTDLYLGYQPWGDLGIDLCLGLPIDVEPTAYMHMFLPDYIESAFNNATFTRNGEKKSLVKKTISTYESKPDQVGEKSLFRPNVVFWLVFVVFMSISFYQFRTKKSYNWIDAVFFSLIGLLGTLLLILWVATDHKAAASNMNILWAIPTHLIAGILLIRNSKPSWLPKYFLLTSLFMLMVVVFWKLLPQMIHYSLMPIVISLGLRGFMIWKTSKHN
ncbi:MAG: DUF4105 domain-containing protein [Cyclobacteriaceae bacterium]|nr:DUF4105 domain-containing protein [Cyclobacteriaceae bacterium]